MATAVAKRGGWMMRWTVTDPITHQLSKRSKMFTGTGGKRAAVAEANRIEATERDTPTASEGRALTLHAYVHERWLPFNKANVSVATLNTNAERIAKVMPYLGTLPLSEITGEAIDAMLTKMAVSGVSSTMRRHYYDVLRTALRQARRWRLISGDPWADAKRPKVQKKRVTAASLDDSHKLSAAFRDADRPIAAAYVDCMADTGARPSEILALHWDSVDLDRGVVMIWRALERVTAGKYRIKQNPKNQGSVRTVALSNRTIEIIRKLKLHHTELHLASGGVWPKEGLVFPNTVGSVWGVHSAAQVIKRMADKIGVASGSYARRHGMASEMLAAGVPPRVIADRMGHASTKMTLDIYNHVLPSHADAAVDFLNKRSEL